MRRSFVVACLLAAGLAGAQTAPDKGAEGMARFVSCVETWATERASSSATAYEVADAALAACPPDRPGVMIFLENDDTTRRAIAYARARAIRAVVDARMPGKR